LRITKDARVHYAVLKIRAVTSPGLRLPENSGSSQRWGPEGTDYPCLQDPTACCDDSPAVRSTFHAGKPAVL